MGAASFQFPHACTAWRKGTEGRTATWRRVSLPSCRFEPTYGASAGERGDDPQRSADLLVKCRNKPLSRGDRVALGTIDADTPPADALTVSTLAMISLGASPHHWEIGLV